MWRNRLCLAALLSLAAAATVHAGGRPEVMQLVDANGNFDRSKVDVYKQVFLSKVYPPYLLADANWVELAMRLIEPCLPDFDAFGPSGSIVPTTVVSKASNPIKSHPASNAGCGRIARLWIRMPFHDCGTYNRKTKTGGCNGSIRFEIPSPADPPFSDDTSTRAPQAPYNNADHPENNGFAGTVDAFNGIRKGLTYKGQPISFADTEVLGGMIALWVCGGDPVPFLPGRVDANGPDQPGLLPSPLDTQDSIIKAFHRMGLTKEDYVVLAGGSHSVGAFNRGCTDSTPDTMDTMWAQEAVAVASKAPGAPPVCDMTAASDFTPSVDLPKAKGQCALQFVVDMAGGGPTTRILQTYANAPNAYFIKRFSASFGKMCNLGFRDSSLPNNFDGFSGNDQETEGDKQNRINVWRKFVQRGHGDNGNGNGNGNGHGHGHGHGNDGNGGGKGHGRGGDHGGDNQDKNRRKSGWHTDAMFFV